MAGAAPPVIARILTHRYVGYAMGGVFKSVNAGTAFTPIVERYSSADIGVIAVDQRDPNIVYVGTGELNNRQTSSFSDGMYKSIEGGTAALEPRLHPEPSRRHRVQHGLRRPVR